MQHSIGLVFGGKSTEHEISIMSARNVYRNINKDKFNPVLIYINREGNWFKIEEEDLLKDKLNRKMEAGLSLDLNYPDGGIFDHVKNKYLELDAVFPVLHGSNGEDGSIQGMFEIIGVAYVGPGILSSAISMDKDIAKKLFINAGLPTSKYLCYRKFGLPDIKFSKVKEELGIPLVIKPASAGSSVGISKVNNETEFRKGIDQAFQFDKKILIEEFIDGREIECAVLGNEEPVASVPGEIISEFYDYEAKYISETKARLEAPAKLTKDQTEQVRNLAIKAYKTLECEGMARVDFFLVNDKFLVNEINTIPGFTNISMYPTLFKLSGISNQELITRLIELAIERFNKNRELNTSYNLPG